MSDENTVTFVCENCQNRVEDAPMTISACVECGGEMVPLVTDSIEVGDEVAYSLGDHTSRTREALVVGVEDYDLWILEGDQTKKENRQRPSKVDISDVVEHRPRGDDGSAVIGVDLDVQEKELGDPYPHEGETIVLVGCGQQKREGEWPAKDLYTSNYFKKKREYAERVGDLWYVLSAEYGLLAPNEVVESYDTHIDEVDAREWEDDVADDLPSLAGATVEVLAGPDYVDALDMTLDLWAEEVRYPTEGMKVGERMSWLKENTPDPAEEDGEAWDLSSRPQPPRDLPEYVVDAVERQSAERLRGLAEWAEQLAAWKDRDLAADDLEAEVSDDEELVDVKDDGSGGTIVEKMIPCGKSNCSTCPHGPYKYRAYRDGDTVKTDYIGPA
ncbi:MAG: DUF6884 domain-containing protein [Halapricum sp.]